MTDLDTLLAAVDPDRLMRHVRRLTDYERLPDSEDERKAFAYLEETLRGFGLEPQRYLLPAYVSLPLSASLTVNGEAFACTTHSMLPGADLEAAIVDVPDSASLPHTRAGGRIVLIDGLAMAPVVHAAQAAGACGVIFVAGSHHYHEMIVSSVWGSPEPGDLDRYAAIPAVTVSYADGQRLRALLAGATEPVRATMRTSVDTRWTRIPVLTADIGPVDRGVLLLTGHVDSWHKGAMDNASGNAAALEIARLLADPALPGAASLRRGLRVVFWSGHSHGRYAGSVAYCDAFFQDLRDKAFLHVNADCLGARGSTLLTQGACMAETHALGDWAIHTVTGQRLEGTRFTRSCDQSFWGTGTPSLFSSVSEQPKPEQADAASKAFALMFGGSNSGGYGWWWHTEADTADKLDPVFLERDTRIFLAVAYKACARPVIPCDVRAGFAEFAAIVRDRATQGPDLPFEPLLWAISRVEAILATFDPEQEDPEALNGLILRFEQILVPLVYVKGSIYGHDPALRQALVPMLEEVADHATERDPHRRQALAILLQRRINHLTHQVVELERLFS